MVVSFYDRKETIDNELSREGLTPDEDEEEWNCYFEFCKMIEEGLTKKSRSVKRKADQMTPKVTKKKESMDRLDFLGKQWDEQSGSTRSSMRLQTKGRMNLAESSGEESDATIVDTPKRSHRMEFESSPIRH